MLKLVLLVSVVILLVISTDLDSQGRNNLRKLFGTSPKAGYSGQQPLTEASALVGTGPDSPPKADMGRRGSVTTGSTSPKKDPPPRPPAKGRSSISAQSNPGTPNAQSASPRRVPPPPPRDPPQGRLSGQGLTVQVPGTPKSPPKKSPPQRRSTDSVRRSSVQLSPGAAVQHVASEPRHSSDSLGGTSTSSHQSLTALNAPAYYIVADTGNVTPDKVSQIVYASNDNGKWATVVHTRRGYGSFIRNSLTTVEKSRSPVSLFATGDTDGKFYVRNNKMWHTKTGHIQAGDMMFCVTDQTGVSFDTFKASWIENSIENKLSYDYQKKYCKWEADVKEEFVWLTYVDTPSHEKGIVKRYSFNSCSIWAGSGGQISMCQCKPSSYGEKCVIKD